MMLNPLLRAVQLGAAGLGVSLTVIACGGNDLNTEKGTTTSGGPPQVSQAVAQDGVKTFVEKNSGRAVAAAKCPSGEPVAPGRTFNCEATLEFDKDLDLTTEQLDSSPDSWPTVGPTGTVLVTQTPEPNAFRYEVEGSGTRSVNCSFTGLTREGTETGRCTDVNGNLRIFANATDALKMPQYKVKLVDISTSTSINASYETYEANGTYAVIKLRVTNTTNSKLAFAPEALSSLFIGKNGQTATEYEPADVTDFVDPSFLGEDAAGTIGAGLSITAPIIFDIAPRLKKKLRKSGSAITFTQSAEGTASDGPATFGYIRLTN